MEKPLPQDIAEQELFRKVRIVFELIRRDVREYYRVHGRWPEVPE